MSDFTKEQFITLYTPLMESALTDAPAGDRWLTAITEDGVITRLHGVCDALIDNAKRFNLTAITEPAAVVEKHIVDSLLPLVYLEEKLGCFLGTGENDGGELISGKIRARIVDVGAGAGFPSLPMGSVLCDKGYKILAVDSTAKKVRHIEETAAKIGVKSGFQAFSGRAEELAHGKLRETFGIATARAVAALPVLIELCGAFVEPGGVFAALKGHCDDEIAAAAAGAAKMGFAPAEKVEYTLPCGDGRSVAIYRKIRRSEIIYPRPYAKISAKPLA